MATTRWGDAISRLLAERGWTKRQLAERAQVRPNTLTNIVTHGRDSDTATLARIATAFGVDIAELFMTREQSLIVESHRESRVERLKGLVVKELNDTVSRIVAQELERTGAFALSQSASREGRAEKYPVRRPVRRRSSTRKKAGS